MDDYKLEKEDYIKFDRLLKVTKSIYSLYNKLYELEIEGKKDSEEYDKVLEYLNLSIEVENNIYKEFNNFFKTISLIDNIIKDLPKKYNFYTESIIKRDLDRNIVQRILITLINRAFTEEDCIYETFIDNIGYYNELICGDLDNLLDKSVEKTLKMFKAIEKDYFNIFLYFLNEVKESAYEETFNNALIKAKYDLSFLNRNIENDLINMRFELPDKIIMNSKFISENITFNNRNYNYMKNVIGKYKADYNIHELLKQYDSDYSNEDCLISNFIRQLFLIASLILVSKKCIEQINNDFNKVIESDEYLKYHSDDKLSQNYISNLIDAALLRKNNIKKNIKKNR